MSLLEDLAARSGCDYLSDLKQSENLKKILLTVDLYAYDIGEWNDAVKYLTERETVCACAEDAVKALLTAAAVPYPDVR